VLVALLMLKELLLVWEAQAAALVFVFRADAFILSHRLRCSLVSSILANEKVIVFDLVFHYLLRFPLPCLLALHQALRISNFDLLELVFFLLKRVNFGITIFLLLFNCCQTNLRRLSRIFCKMCHDWDRDYFPRCVIHWVPDFQNEVVFLQLAF